MSRTLRRLGFAALVALAAVSCACGAVYGSLPSTSDAVARVELILRAHGARFIAIPARARVARAIVAVEDQRFFDHGAIDPVAVGRVLVDTVTHPGSDPGGSTIAQQLAKTLYVRDPGSLIGRLQAIGLAFKLEHDLSKREILQLYLNAIFFGHGYYGVARAARGYFDRAPGALSWRQAALLAGLPQAPSAYDPVAHPSLAWERRREVLGRLAATAVLPIQLRTVGGAEQRALGAFPFLWDEKAPRARPNDAARRSKSGVARGAGEILSLPSRV